MCSYFVPTLCFWPTESCTVDELAVFWWFLEASAKGQHYLSLTVCRAPSANAFHFVACSPVLFWPLACDGESEVSMHVERATAISVRSGD